MYMCISVYMYICIYIHIYVDILIYICLYIYIYMSLHMPKTQCRLLRGFWTQLPSRVGPVDSDCRSWRGYKPCTGSAQYIAQALYRFCPVLDTSHVQILPSTGYKPCIGSAQYWIQAMYRFFPVHGTSPVQVLPGTGYKPCTSHVQILPSTECRPCTGSARYRVQAWISCMPHTWSAWYSACPVQVRPAVHVQWHANTST